MSVICEFGLPGIAASNIEFNKFVHPSIKSSKNKEMANLVEIIYHLIRCEYIHNGQIISNLSFVEGTKIGNDEKSIILPQKIVLDLIAVVLSSLKNSCYLKEKFEQLTKN